MKTSLEFQNHIRAVQWIAERLGLNEPADKTKPPETMFRGFMALPLTLPERKGRLPVRVDGGFRELMLLGIGASWGSFTTGVMLRYNLEEWKLSLATGLLIGILFRQVFARKATELQEAANKILEDREPPGILIKYRKQPN